MVYRHAFPGPGLGVRILGEVKKEYADTLRLADHIFIQELHAAGLYHKTSLAFAVFLPVKSVGVVGDARRYEYVVALRAVETIDFMTARWSHLPYEFLEKFSSRIINEISGISRVTYDMRLIQTALHEWAYARAYDNADQRAEQLPVWLHQYNWHRPLKPGLPASCQSAALTEQPGGFTQLDY